MPNLETERYELEQIGATPVKNSGRGKFDKSDGIIFSPDGDPLLTIDVKEYETSFPLNLKNVAKLQTDAKMNRTEPAFLVVLGKEEPRQRMMVITTRFFDELYEAWKEKYFG